MNDLDPTRRPLTADAGAIAHLVLDPAPAIPESALAMAARLLADTLAVAAGAAPLEAGRIGRETALALYGAADPAWQARLLFDGRPASLAGAAFAAATQIDNLDAHDGLNPTKGHVGCAVVPALFAFAERCPDLSGRDALAAMVIAYEVAARAAFALHATAADYHTSGAWNALGVAALGCRLLGSDAETLRHALGIAEYHGPRSQMMREIDNPSMLHDGSGMGALTGVSAAIMALKGFEGAPAITVEAPEAAPFWADLGTRWTIEQSYVKPYPICRWAHAAIDAVAALRAAHALRPEQIASLRVRSFAEAARLFRGMPDTTSRAQYSLAFPVATMLLHGRVGPEHVSGAGLSDPAIAAFLPRIAVEEAERHSARFPELRRADVTITLTDGSVLTSGDVNARGGPDAPLSDAELGAKIRDYAGSLLGPEGADRLFALCTGLSAPEARFADLARLCLARPAPAGAP
ncbi:MAG: MmgE/PrpD family protein [Pseudomonadota bacterium]